MRVCGHCKVEKEATAANYHRDTKRPVGLHSICKRCRSQYYKGRAQAAIKRGQADAGKPKCLADEQDRPARLPGFYEVNGTFYCTQHGVKSPCASCAKARMH